MPPKEDGPNEPKATSKHKNDDDDDETQKPARSYRRIAPAPPKRRRNPYSATAQVQQRTPGYGPTSRPYSLSTGSSPAIKQEVSDSPSVARPMGCFVRQNEQTARERISSLRRAGNTRPVMVSPGTTGPQPPPRSHNGGGSGVPTVWYPRYDGMYQNSMTHEQRRAQSGLPSTLSVDSGSSLNGGDSSWMADMVMTNPPLLPTAGPIQNTYQSAVHAPNTIFSPGNAPVSLPGGYNGDNDLHLLLSTDEVLWDYNVATTVDSAHRVEDTWKNGVEFDFKNTLPHIPEQWPQPLSQAQGTNLHQEATYGPQPPAYAQPGASAYVYGSSHQQQQIWPTPAHATGYSSAQQQSWPSSSYAVGHSPAPQQTYNPPQPRAVSSLMSPYNAMPLQPQQQFEYASPYANYLQPQHQPAVPNAHGHQFSFAPSVQFNNVVGNNIMVNYAPSSSSLPQNAVSLDGGQQIAQQQLDLGMAGGEMGETVGTREVGEAG